MIDQLKAQIELTWNDRALLKEAASKEAIRDVIELLDKGKLRVAEKTATDWQVNEWVKKAILLYFPICESKTIEAGPFEFFDKIPTKKDYASQKVRVVPQAIARYGSYLAPNVIMMPSYVNIGAYVWGRGVLWLKE